MKLAKLLNGEPEIFYTLQGEGIHTGRPSIFVRLSLCNLQCVWCDTPYTWNWEGTSYKTTSGIKYRKEELLVTLGIEELINKVKDYPCKNLVITGGEPLVQQKELKEFLSLLPSSYSIEIETNGTIIPEILSEFRAIQYNVSPKLSHSGNPRGKALIPEAITWFKDSGQAYFKFVISHPDDLIEIEDIQQAHEIPSERIILMSKGISEEELSLTSTQVTEFSLKNGYHYSDRLHVRLWGNTRGT